MARRHAHTPDLTRQLRLALGPGYAAAGPSEQLLSLASTTAEQATRRPCAS